MIVTKLFLKSYTSVPIVSLLTPTGTRDKSLSAGITLLINTFSGTTGIFGALILYLSFNDAITLSNSSANSSSLKICAVWNSYTLSSLTKPRPYISAGYSFLVLPTITE